MCRYRASHRYGVFFLGQGEGHVGLHRHIVWHRCRVMYNHTVDEYQPKDWRSIYAYHLCYTPGRVRSTDAGAWS